MHQIEVGRLSHTASREIVDANSPGGALPEALVAYILDQSDGVPLNLEQARLVSLDSSYTRTEQACSGLSQLPRGTNCLRLI